MVEATLAAFLLEASGGSDLDLEIAQLCYSKTILLSLLFCCIPTYEVFRVNPLYKSTRVRAPCELEPHCFIPELSTPRIVANLRVDPRAMCVELNRIQQKGASIIVKCK